jgi:hypothetical protein
LHPSKAQGVLGVKVCRLVCPMRLYSSKSLVVLGATDEFSHHFEGPRRHGFINRRSLVSDQGPRRFLILTSVRFPRCFGCNRRILASYEDPRGLGCQTFPNRRSLSFEGSRHLGCQTLPNRRTLVSDQGPRCFGCQILPNRRLLTTVQSPKRFRCQTYRSCIHQRP